MICLKKWGVPSLPLPAFYSFPFPFEASLNPAERTEAEIDRQTHFELKIMPLLIQN